MSPRTHDRDIERLAGLGIIRDCRQVPKEQSECHQLPRSATIDKLDIQDRVGQFCFLCLKSQTHGQYAVLVSCLRPTKVRRRQHVVFADDENEDNDDIQPFDEEGRPQCNKARGWDSACESDTEIYRRLVNTCYQNLGWWKRWLPYHGITEVVEVKLQLAGKFEQDGHYPIVMKPVEPDNVLEECNKIIARHPTGPYKDINDSCIENYNHSHECWLGMTEWLQPCRKESAEKATQRRNRLLFLSHLKDCARKPERANGLRTLEGMSQESCIYDKSFIDALFLLPSQEFAGLDVLRGLHFVLGWQTDRMSMQLPLKASCAWFVIAFIWLCLVLWRGAGGDWGTAFAFAQVVAASVSIVIACAQS